MSSNYNYYQNPVKIIQSGVLFGDWGALSGLWIFVYHLQKMY